MQAIPSIRRTNTTRTRRGAFSLVELLIVITIIIILLGLLLVGVNGAMKKARIVSCSTEISNLSKGIADFKQQYGVEPPSFIVLYEDPTDWVPANTPAQPASLSTTERERLRNLSRSTVRSIWPNYNFSVPVDINQNGASGDTLVLNGAECLVFFLGGVREPNVDLDGDGDPSNDFALTGFSANPESPFVRSSIASTRIGPFYQFDPARLNEETDPTPDGMPEFFDNLPGQITPLQYFSSYDGTGYRPRGLDNTINTADDEAILGGLITHYIVENSAGAGSIPASRIPSTSWNPSSFQIISPGFDGEFGLGGVYGKDNQFPTGATANDYGMPSPRDVAVERDNITNFKGGTLN